MTEDAGAARRFSCADVEERRRGIEAAVAAVQRGELVVLPTDTVYGVGADAFEPDAVDRLLQAKGRERSSPPPVLVGAASALDGVAREVPETARRLVEAFWPGGLTIICLEQPSLMWDLGDNRGTVAVRMPDDEVALELLRNTGPLAVSSANRTGEPPATTAAEAENQLGDSIAVYLDGGATEGVEPSSIVDLSRGAPCLLRAGVLSLEQLREVVPELVDVNELDDLAELEELAEPEPTDEDTTDVSADARTQTEAGEADAADTDAEAADAEAADAEAAEAGDTETKDTDTEADTERGVSSSPGDR